MYKHAFQPNFQDSRILTNFKHLNMYISQVMLLDSDDNEAIAILSIHPDLMSWMYYSPLGLNARLTNTHYYFWSSHWDTEVGVSKEIIERWMNIMQRRRLFGSALWTSSFLQELFIKICLFSGQSDQLPSEEANKLLDLVKLTQQSAINDDR